MLMTRLHLVALPHTQVSREFYHCAYTQKIVNFCKMMQGNYDIQLYAPEGPEVIGATLYPCQMNTRRKEIFGEDDQGRLYSWPSDEQSAEFNANVITVLKKNWKPGELILLSSGYTYRDISAAFPEATKAEPFVGYYGILNETFHAFESYSHLSQVYMRSQINDVRYFDCVIPPYVDADDFPLLNKRGGKYLLYIGRLIQRKGIATAADIAKAVHMPLYVAGAGAKHLSPGLIIGEEGTRIEGDVKYCGPVDQEERNELMAGAAAVLVCTTYLEPGGNVSLEANFSGTPVLAIDAGVFAETVKPGVNGYRFRTLKDAVQGIESCRKLSPRLVRGYAEALYSLEATAPKFDKWFKDLQTLQDKGWYSLEVVN